MSTRGLWMTLYTKQGKKGNPWMLICVLVQKTISLIYNYEFSVRIQEMAYLGIDHKPCGKFLENFDPLPLLLCRPIYNIKQYGQWTFGKPPLPAMSTRFMNCPLSEFHSGSDIVYRIFLFYLGPLKYDGISAISVINTINI